MAAKEEMFYVGLTDPVAVRRNLLESSKAIVQALQRYEEIKKLKAEKEEQIEEFNMLVKELTERLAGLKAELPKADLKNLPKQRPSVIKEAEKAPAKKAKAAKKQKTQEKPVKKKLSVVDRLEKELDDIESKLKGL